MTTRNFREVGFWFGVSSGVGKLVEGFFSGGNFAFT